MIQWRREGGRADRRPALGPVVLLPPGPDGQGAARGVDGPARRARAEARLELPGRGGPAGRRRWAEPSAEDVLRRINGYDVATGKAVNGYLELKADGSTACGCWIYSGRLRGRGEPGRAPQAALGAGPVRRRVGLDLAREPARALQPRLGRPGRQAVERAQEARLVGRREGRVDRPRHPGLPADHRTRPRPGEGDDRARRACAATTRSSCRPTARRGCSRRTAWSTGRCPRTTRPTSRRCATRSTASRATRPSRSTGGADNPSNPNPNPLEPGDARRVPVRAHHRAAHRAPHGGRDEPAAALPVGAAARAVRRGLPRAGPRCAG